MYIETLLLDFMAKVNDALKNDVSETEKLKTIYQAKYWAEIEYAKIVFPDGSIFDGTRLVEARMKYP